MRVLLVTYYFPPAGGGGVQRVLSWCRHLPTHGVELTVVAPNEPHWIDQDTTLVIPGDTQVLRTADPSPAAVIPREALAQVRGVRRVLRRIALQPRRFAVPDIHRPWRRHAVAAVRAEARRRAEAGEPMWDVVVSSSPPETTHLVAHDIAKLLGIPWVADYRDSWLDLPHLRMSSIAVRWKHRANRRLATRLMRRAAAATTVSEPLATDLRARHPHLDVHVLENGVEPAEVSRAHARADGFRDHGKFVVAYTGNFFGQQRASEFLDGLDAALAAEPELRDDLLVRFVGGLKPHELDRALSFGDVIEHVPFLRHDDVLAQQRAADLLLFYVAPGRGSQGVYTGKVFEYVAARRPVLALSPADNVATRLLDEAGATAAAAGARVDPDDVPAIGDSLLTAWRAWRDAGGRDGGRTPDIDVPTNVLERIDRESVAQRLAQALRSIVERHAR
ncbi:MAG: putative glycosyltransferase [Thermoleophilia bacterium]|nr:putative glycosyltransferase [Thermoleophilia bacterium]